MHSQRIDHEWTVQYNGDFSGDIIFHKVGPMEEMHKLPFFVLAFIVGEKVRSDAIARLESLTPCQIIGELHKL